ncbi:MAG: hypothetical protein EAZ89_14130, partial [Bacteroidetes bacterium]
MKNLLAYSKVLVLLSLISSALVGCTDKQIGKEEKPDVKSTNWVRIDSTIGIKERNGQSIYSDGQRLIFSTPNALYTYPGSGSATQSFRFD